MATPTQRRPAAPSGGKKPLPAQKLIYVADKLGLDGLKGMQGSTVNIVDTVTLTTNAERQVLTFFAQAQGKSRSFSNFQNGSLQAGEAMVIEQVAFIFIVSTDGVLTSNANAIKNAIPVTLASATQYPNSESFFAGGLMNISIANSKVVKDYNMNEGLPAFNPKNTSMVAFDVSDADQRYMGANVISLESPPVLPPNQALAITVEIPPTGTVPSYTHIMCVAGRFGSIFAAKTTL